MNGTSFQPLDKYLKLGVLMDSMREVYISQSHKEAEDAQPISLLAAQHFVCKVSAPFGSSSSAATVDFEVAVLSRPRLCNCNGLWLLPSIYIALGMKVCQGVPSKWINKSIPRWTSFFQNCSRACTSRLQATGAMVLLLNPCHWMPGCYLPMRSFVV